MNGETSGERIIKLSPNRARQTLIARIRFAGYHNDQKEAIRLYVENRISYSKYIAAYREGRSQFGRGVPCNCAACREKKEGTDDPSK